MIDGWGFSCGIVLRWKSLDRTDAKSTLVQVMAWCRQATSHYLSQCWSRSMSPYGITRPQWVKVMAWCRIGKRHHQNHCWPMPKTRYGVTKLQWENIVFWAFTMLSLRYMHSSSCKRQHVMWCKPILISQRLFDGLAQDCNNFIADALELQ